MLIYVTLPIYLTIRVGTDYLVLWIPKSAEVIFSICCKHCLLYEILVTCQATEERFIAVHYIARIEKQGCGCGKAVAEGSVNGK